VTVTPAIDLECVAVRRGTTLAAVDLTIQVSTGERVAIVGPSGAGKTTLLDVMGTVLTPTAGHVRVLGEDVCRLRSADLRSLRRRIGVVAQRPPLAGPLRVIHQVNAGRLARWSTPRALWSLVRPSGIAGATDALEALGVAHTLWSRADELSGGERQRVALARLLVQDVELVLVDEPVAGLDPARSSDVIRLLSEVVAPGRTLVCSLHQFELARSAFDRVIGLRGGRVVFDEAAGQVGPDHAAALYDLGKTIPR
jgi:phosphonate transport system ATP-binding protein